MPESLSLDERDIAAERALGGRGTEGCQPQSPCSQADRRAGTRLQQRSAADADPGQIVSWLYRVSQNAIADYWRAFYRLPVIGSDQMGAGWEPADTAVTDSGAEEPSTAGGGERARKQVESLLRRLPANYRRVLELRFIQRLTVAETADQMGITRGNAKVLQYRALRKAALVGEAADG